MINKIIGMAILVMVGFGCSSKMDMSKKNFSTAIEKNLKTNGDACFEIHVWPVQIQNGSLDMLSDRFVREMAALEKAGLISVKNGLVQFTPGDKKMYTAQGKIYDLTDAAKPFMRSGLTRTRDINGDIKNVTGQAVCWGKVTLSEVTKWDMPITFGDYHEVTVYWNANLTDVAAWISRPDVISNLPNIKTVLAASKALPRSSVLKLSSEGWEDR